MIPYKDLREFLDFLSRKNELKKITHEISPYLEMTEISQRVLNQQGPALLFQNPKHFKTPVLTNLFGTVQRLAYGMGEEDIACLKDIGRSLAYLKEPEPPKGIKDLWDKFPLLKQVITMRPKEVTRAVCQENILEGDAVDLGQWPIQTCWPEDAGPLLTWGLVITKGPHHERQNLGIYRQQVIGKNRLIMRWLAHRGGALDYQTFCKANPGKKFPIAVAIGADPATILAAVTPIPDTLSEYAFAGLLRGHKTELVRCVGETQKELFVPAHSEIILEGYIAPEDTAPEGPFGDHTGYYNEVETFPVFTVERITHRDNPIYHSTHTGRPPDEPAILGVALNDIFVPLLQKQFPEITDFYLPPEGCSYRMAVVTIKKAYPGHAKRIMMGVWSFLRQFMYTKFVIVTDDDINARDWKDVMWAITTRMDPSRDCTFIDNTPIDYLDFASPVSGLGSKIGMDATNKWRGETQREWGRVCVMHDDVSKYIDTLWPTLDLLGERHDNPLDTTGTR